MSRKRSTASPLTVKFTVSGTATPGNDYAPIGDSVTLSPNEEEYALGKLNSATFTLQ